MKKIIVLLISILLLTGCSFTNIEKSSINEILNQTLSINIKMFNNVFDGYKYYVPRGLKVIEKNNYNTRILQNKDVFYVYTDVVAYFYKTEKDFTPSDTNYFSKELNYNNKKGYIDISEVDDKYFVEFMYNYSKIEAFVSKENLKYSIVNMCYILSSVKYNDSIINTLIGENILEYKEEKFDIFSSKKGSDTFLEFYERYESEKYNDDDEKDQDVLYYESIE